MPSGPTYYDFLGVSPAAPPEQIRSAYLALMKQHHPDLSETGEKAGTDEVAALLNLCYDVLKDPLKRARYDSFLALEAREQGRARLRHRALLTGETYRPRRRRWDASSIAAGVLALMIGGTLVALPWLPFGSPALSSTSIAAPESYSASTSPAPPESQPSATRELAPAIARELGESGVPELGPSAVSAQVRLAMTEMPDEAEIESGRCFDEAHEQSSLAMTEMCVVFDDAYVDWNQTQPLAGAQSLYFKPAVVRIRHEKALAEVGAFAQARLDQLKEMTLTALLAEVRSQVGEGSDSHPPTSLAPMSQIEPEMSR
jgi:hypothetical protein